MAEYPDHEIEGATYIRLREPARLYIVQRYDGMGQPAVGAAHRDLDEAERLAATINLEDESHQAIVIEQELPGQTADDWVEARGCPHCGRKLSPETRPLAGLPRTCSGCGNSVYGGSAR
jgi:hypothetical protein